MINKLGKASVSQIGRQLEKQIVHRFVWDLRGQLADKHDIQFEHHQLLDLLWNEFEYNLMRKLDCQLMWNLNSQIHESLLNL